MRRLTPAFLWLVRGGACSGSTSRPRFAPRGCTPAASPTLRMPRGRTGKRAMAGATAHTVARQRSAGVRRSRGTTEGCQAKAFEFIAHWSLFGRLLLQSSLFLVLSFLCNLDALFVLVKGVARDREFQYTAVNPRGCAGQVPSRRSHVGASCPRQPTSSAQASCTCTPAGAASSMSEAPPHLLRTSRIVRGISDHSSTSCATPCFPASTRQTGPKFGPSQSAHRKCSPSRSSPDVDKTSSALRPRLALLGLMMPMQRTLKPRSYGCHELGASDPKDYAHADNNGILTHV